jgi:hypothetical protein
VGASLIHEHRVRTFQVSHLLLPSGTFGFFLLAGS